VGSYVQLVLSIDNVQEFALTWCGISYFWFSSGLWIQQYLRMSVQAFWILLYICPFMVSVLRFVLHYFTGEKTLLSHCRPLAFAFSNTLDHWIY